MQTVYDPTFYVDECLDSTIFIGYLRRKNFQIVRHRDVFGKGVSDDKWAEYAKLKGYYALTEDNKIRTDKKQSKVILGENTGVFIIRCKRCWHSEKGKLVYQCADDILDFIRNNNVPFIATIKRTGLEGCLPKDRVWK